MIPIYLRCNKQAKRLHAELFQNIKQLHYG